MKGKTILIVEDDAKIRQLLKIYLEKEGYEILLAADGAEGMKLFEKLNPCFVIMDSHASAQKRGRTLSVDPFRHEERYSDHHADGQSG